MQTEGIERKSIILRTVNMAAGEVISPACQYMDSLFFYDENYQRGNMTQVSRMEICCNVIQKIMFVINWTITHGFRFVVDFTSCRQAKSYDLMFCPESGNKSFLYHCKMKQEKLL